MNDFRPAIRRALGSQTSDGVFFRLVCSTERSGLIARSILAGDSNANTLANRLQCCAKTVHRDIADLRKSGLPIRFDPQQNTFRFEQGL